MIKSKLKVVECKLLTGTVDTRHLFNYEQYARTLHEFRNEPLFDIDLIGEDRRRQTRVILSDFVTRTVFEDGSYLDRFFKRGYMTDLASVPKKLRSLVDNDDPRIILPALNHDGDYGTMEVEFRTANRQFYHSIRACGGGPYFASKAFLPVASPIGRKNYNRNEDTREEVKKFVSYEFHEAVKSA